MINQITRKATLWVSFISLLGSITLNVILYKETRKYYTLLYAAELDPLGLSYFQGEETLQFDDKPTVVFYGDSRAAQWSTPRIEGFTFINRGIGNQTSIQILLRFEEQIQPLQPDIIIVQVCINDLKTIPLFPGREQEIITNCKKNIQAIINKSLELKSTVILTTVFPTSGDVPLARRPVWAENIYSAIEEVNNFILDSQKEKVIIFDTARILADSDGNIKDEFVFDLLHINKKGYDAINLELIKLLEELK